MKRASFKDKTLRAHYDGMIRGFRIAHRDIGTPEARCRGNSFASAFWLGFDGITAGRGNFRDRVSRRTLSFACYRAGQFCRAEHDAKVSQPPVSHIEPSP